jgi:hypothetical protein
MVGGECEGGEGRDDNSGRTRGYAGGGGGGRHCCVGQRFTTGGDDGRVVLRLGFGLSGGTAVLRS